MGTEQNAVRLPTDQLEVLDDLVTRGMCPTRAAAVRAGIDVLVEIDQRCRDDQAIVAGHRRTPPTDVETAAAVVSLINAIAEETW